MPARFTQQDFARLDESGDEEFYRIPRMVVHIDNDAIAAVTNVIRHHVAMDAHVLDLMSSFRSHLPQEAHYREVVGLGMSTAEMQANTQLTRFLVQNLNANPVLPFSDGSFDAVLNTVSIQYLQRPVEVFQEVARVLKPGGISIVTFSDRMFPTKAVKIWREGSNEEHIALVQQYYELAGGYTRVEIERYVDKRSSWFSRGHDPLFAVIGMRATPENG